MSADKEYAYTTGITSLVYAREPREAAEKVIKMTVCGRRIDDER